MAAELTVSEVSTTPLPNLVARCGGRLRLGSFPISNRIYLGVDLVLAFFILGWFPASFFKGYADAPHTLDLLNRQAFFQTLSVLASVTDINVAHVLP
jgi:hypothetical protein